MERQPRDEAMLRAALTLLLTFLAVAGATAQTMPGVALNTPEMTEAELTREDVVARLAAPTYDVPIGAWRWRPSLWVISANCSASPNHESADTTSTSQAVILPTEGSVLSNKPPPCVAVVSDLNRELPPGLKCHHYSPPALRGAVSNRYSAKQALNLRLG
jgi:hypothetical protein